jgi:hypothetical protein
MGKINNYEAIQPVGDNFRELPIKEAFTWQDGLVIDGITRSLYNFRSRFNLAVDPSKIGELYKLDGEASEEASLMPGYEHYFHDDDLSDEGLGSSFCIWSSDEQAFIASKQPKHEAAKAYIRGEGKDVYLEYHLDRYYLMRDEAGIHFTPIYY